MVLCSRSKRVLQISGLLLVGSLFSVAALAADAEDLHSVAGDSWFMISDIEGHDQPGQPSAGNDQAGVSGSSSSADNTERFSGAFASDRERFDVGVDLYSTADAKGALILYGKDVAMKFGGFVKTDFIYDFDPIDSTDSFVTTLIPVGAPPRTNTRLHARQTRFNFDTRWLYDDEVIRFFVEGDFFGEGNSYRLRHAFGEVGSLLVGRTWTTFTDIAAAPATLDFEGSVSTIARRQAQVRWTAPFLHEGLTWSVALEDALVIIDEPEAVMGNERTPSADVISRLRLEREWGQLQIAGLYHLLGFQPTGHTVITKPGWGAHFSGVLLLSSAGKVYGQILVGDGIGSYRDLPDAAPSGVASAELLAMFGWMIGTTFDWTDQLSSNFTYAENSLDNAAFQPLDDVHKTTYLAANLIWQPLERVSVGIEYLYGTRENIDGRLGAANRLQTSVIFDFP